MSSANQTTFISKQTGKATNRIKAYLFKRPTLIKDTKNQQTMAKKINYRILTISKELIFQITFDMKNL